MNTKKKNTLREQLAEKPILIRLLSDIADDNNGMLCLNEKDNFEFVWNGVGKDGRMLAEFSNGYLAFDYVRPMPFFNVKPDQITTRPYEIVYSTKKAAVEANTFDRLVICYNNFFKDFRHDVHTGKAVDILEHVNKKDLRAKGLNLDIYIGGKMRNSIFPLKAEYKLDTLNIQLTGKGKVALDKVNVLVDNINKVVALFKGMPVDPVIIKLGLESSRFPSEYDYATFEHSKPYMYSKIPIKFTNALPLTEHAAFFADALLGSLKADSTRELALWFSYLEADYKRYYLDTIMSILLSTAESTYYLLPKADTTKREQEFDEMLTKIELLGISRKLLTHIKRSRHFYTDPITFETKIRGLIKHSGVNVTNEVDLAKYLGQLRNSLMHGVEPRWGHIVDSNGISVKEIDVIAAMHSLRDVLSSILKKQLIEG